MNFGGVQVVTSSLAVETKVHFAVEEWPTKKKRRGWRVVRHEELRPCAYMVSGGTMIVHPEILARLKDHANGLC